jgi:hypothetical protein
MLTKAVRGSASARSRGASTSAPEQTCPRSYRQRFCLYDLGHVCSGAEVDAPLDRALADPRTAFVNIHTAPPGSHPDMKDC